MVFFGKISFGEFLHHMCQQGGDLYCFNSTFTFFKYSAGEPLKIILILAVCVLFRMFFSKQYCYAAATSTFEQFFFKKKVQLAQFSRYSDLSVYSSHLLCCDYMRIMYAGPESFSDNFLWLCVLEYVKWPKNGWVVNSLVFQFSCMFTRPPLLSLSFTARLPG